MYVRQLASVILALGILCLVVRASRPGIPSARRPFPRHVISPGPLPALWIFFRSQCPHCRRHLAALQQALTRLPRSQRLRAGAHTHLVGDTLQEHPDVQRHSKNLQAALDEGPLPSTWWVDADTNVTVWRGSLDATAWDALLTRLLREAAP